MDIDRGIHKRVNNCEEMQDRRRSLRSNATMAEAMLWNLLKRRNVAGLQFRRQFSVEHFVLDFYCPAIRLAIELDGDYHFHVNQPQRDYARDRYLLERYGILTLRFENKIAVKQNWLIVNAIVQAQERFISQGNCYKPYSNEIQ